jgi:hypothetical protein
VLGAFPDYAPQQVINYLIAHSQDLGPSGPDAAYGYGGLHLPEPQANQAPPLDQIPPTPVEVAPVLITPLPPAQDVTGNRLTTLLVCLGGIMCLGALGVLGGLILLAALMWPKPRPPQPIVPSVPAPSAEPACLLTNEGQRHVLPLGTMTIGRSSENTLALPEDNQVSRHHAVIHWDGRICTVTDLGSSNGTIINNERIPANVACPLHTGDRIRFGFQAKFVVRLPG